MRLRIKRYCQLNIILRFWLSRKHIIECAQWSKDELNKNPRYLLDTTWHGSTQEVYQALSGMPKARRENLSLFGSFKFAKHRVDDAPPSIGPLFVLNRSNPGEKTTEKVYISLLTWASTRAIHLELVENSSAEQFPLAFHRFIEHKDCFICWFQTTQKTLKTLAKEIQIVRQSRKVQDHLAIAGVHRVKCPMVGGFWERLFRIVKDYIKWAVGRVLLTFEELRTILTEAELYNVELSRPLTYVYFGTDGISYPLSSAQLIYGRRISAKPSNERFDIVSTYESLTRRAKHHWRLLQHFTKHWRHECLTCLRENVRN